MVTDVNYWDLQRMAAIEKGRCSSSADSWVCTQCGHVGGFILHGCGIIECPGCHALHLVSLSGAVTFVGPAGVRYD